jgi:hypothetical protein
VSASVSANTATRRFVQATRRFSPTPSASSTYEKAIEQIRILEWMATSHMLQKTLLFHALAKPFGLCAIVGIVLVQQPIDQFLTCCHPPLALWPTVHYVASTMPHVPTKHCFQLFISHRRLTIFRPEFGCRAKATMLSSDSACNVADDVVILRADNRLIAATYFRSRHQRLGQQAKQQQQHKKEALPMCCRCVACQCE